MSFALQLAVPLLPPPPRVLARHRGYVFTEERFSWLRYEGEALFEQHHQEASHDLSVPLDLAWDIFGKAEQISIAACVTVRRHGELVGYATFIMAPSTHYAHTIADADSFYIDPAHRKGWLGIKLLQVAEELLREKGVFEVLSRIKTHVHPGKGGRDLGPLLKFLGYQPVERTFRKRIA